MKKTWMVVLVLLLALLMLGCAGAEEEYLGTFQKTKEIYCNDCESYQSATIGYYNEWRHWFPCPECNTVTGYYYHEASCDSPDVCQGCGMSDVEMDRVRCNNNRLIQHSATQHWVICADCGQYLDYHYEHWSYCDAPTVCAFCKESNVVIAASNVVHSDEADTEIRYDDTQHWWYCTGCGEDHLWPEAHERDCEDDYCRVCKRSDVAFTAVRHTNTVRTSVSSTLCGEYCTDCGELIDAEPHWGYCTDPGICARCDTSGVTLEEMYHLGGSDLEHDSTHHWSACRTCGEAQYKEKHYAICSDPDYCIYCGADGITARVIDHDWDSYVPGHDNTHCWSQCSICGEKEAITRHFTTDCTKPSLCENCGASGVSCLVYHSYEVFDTSGGHFYITTAEYDSNGHWWTCADCGDDTRYDHAFNQDNLCVACGYQAEDPCEHPKSTWVYEPVYEDAHIAFCGECGSPMYFETQDGYFLYGDHTGTCATPDVCIYCGGTDIAANGTIHSTKTKFLHDATAHWRGCADCGAILDVSTVEKHAFVDLICTVCGYEGAHTKHTFENYVCTVCGYAAFENALGTFEYTDDPAWCSDCSVDVYTGVYTQTECWFACPECCKVIHKFGLHRASCDEPEVCINCRASGVTISEVTHFDSTAKYDSTHHWEECACGEQSNRAEHTLTSQWNDAKHWTACTECDYVLGYQNYHTADCTAPDVCKDCGQRNVTIYEVVHDWATLFNDTYHWNVCADCGEQSGSMNRHSSRVYVKVSATECGIGCENCDYIRPTTYPHEAKCDAPTTCTYCGGTDIITDHVEHDYDWDTYVKISDTECGNPCLGCSAYDVYSHLAYCTAPDTCHYCGSSGVTLQDIECPGDYAMYHDQYYHWEGCVYCGKQFDHVYGHEAECDNPNTCYYCDATNVHMQELWHDDSEYSYDQYYHWRTCSRCNEKTWYQQHTRRCNSTTKQCNWCYAIVDDAAVVITHSTHMPWMVPISNTQHQERCVDCNELVGKPANHMADCSNPTHCIQCGADNVTAEYSHDIDYDTDPEYDNTHHWYACTKCGARAGVERHENTHDCTKPNVCTYCDATNVDTILYHAYEHFDGGEHNRVGHVFSSAEGHWWHCSRCGDETIHPHEFGKGSICEVCQYPKPATRTPGDATGDGRVTLADAILILEYATGSSANINLSNANVNADSDVDLHDALIILQHAAGWNVVLK